MDEEEIKLPEFDEKKFKETEKRKAKTSFISFLFGIFIAIISQFLWTHLDAAIRWPLLFLFAISSIGFLGKILQYLKIDIRKFSKKEWMGSISFYFFTWLAFFILFLNPPFYDASPPKIEVAVMPAIQQINENVSIFAKVTDNVGVKDVKINLSGMHDMEKYKFKGFYFFNYSGNKNTSFEIIAKDENGHVSRYKGMLHFSQAVIYIESNGTIEANQTIKIFVLKNVSAYRVYYIVNGNEVNASFSKNQGNYAIYTTSPIYQGWKAGENEIQPCAEIIHYMKNTKIPLKATIKGKIYKINVINSTTIGSKAPPAVKKPVPPPIRTPGFEFVMVLVAIILVMRRKKK